MERRRLERLERSGASNSGSNSDTAIDIVDPMITDSMIAGLMAADLMVAGFMVIDLMVASVVMVLVAGTMNAAAAVMVAVPINMTALVAGKCITSALAGASRRWFGLANARPKQSQPRNLVIEWMSA